MKQALLLSACLVVASLIAGEFDPYFRQERPQDALQDGPREELGGDSTILFCDARSGLLVCKELLHSNGGLASRHLVLHDLLHGVQRKWSPSGILMEESPYENGLGHGRFREWDNKGVLIADYVLHHGSGLKRAYYSSGQLKEEVPFKAGHMHGVARTYYANGQIQSYGEWANGIAQNAAFTWDASGFVYFFVSPALSGKLHGVSLRLTHTQRDGRHPSSVTYWVHDRSTSPEDYRQAAALDSTLPRYCEKLDDYLQVLDTSLTALKDKIGPMVRIEFDPRRVY